MPNKVIGILGCGWLGYELALQLKKQAYQVRGTSRTDEKLLQLSEKGIHAFKMAMYKVF